MSAFGRGADNGWTLRKRAVAAARDGRPDAPAASRGPPAAAGGFLEAPMLDPRGARPSLLPAVAECTAEGFPLLKAASAAAVGFKCRGPVAFGIPNRFPSPSLLPAVAEPLAPLPTPLPPASEGGGPSNGSS